MEHRVQWMRWDDPVNQHAAEIQQVLDGVHRQPRPRPGIHVLVMQVVGRLVQRFPVSQTVYPVEVKVAQQRDGQHQQHEVDRAGCESDRRQHAVGVQPQRDRLVRGPDQAAAHQGPEHVVPGLVAEHEGAIVGARPTVAELVANVLGALDVEPQVHRAVEHDDQHRVAGIDLGDPADREGAGAAQVRREPEPADHREHGVEEVVRPVESDQGSQCRPQPERPGKQRRRRRQRVGEPLTAPVAVPEVSFSHNP